MNKIRDNCDVLVIGAGSTGLTCANLDGDTNQSGNIYEKPFLMAA